MIPNEVRSQHSEADSGVTGTQGSRSSYTLAIPIFAVPQIECRANSSILNKDSAQHDPTDGVFWLPRNS